MKNEAGGDVYDWVTRCGALTREDECFVAAADEGPILGETDERM